MESKNVKLIVALVMIAIAVIFFIYALSNPQASFLWSNSVTYAIYGVYGIITGVVWVLVLKHKSK